MMDFITAFAYGMSVVILAGALIGISLAWDEVPVRKMAFAVDVYEIIVIIGLLAAKSM